MKSCWFFGDSFVYGYGCRPTSRLNRIMSEIVSRRFARKEMNLAKYGYSNDNIIFSIITNLSKMKKGDYVIIFDTHSGRSPFVSDKLDYYKDWPENSYFNTFSENIEMLYSVRAVNVDKLLPYYQTLYQNLVLHLNSIGIKSYYFPSNDNWWQEHFFDTNTPEDGGHWSFKGHKQVAELIVNTILDSKII